MGRAIRRAGITIVAACATALAMALPASAKGPVIPIRMTTSVSGPGISAPIMLHWGGDCPFPESGVYWVQFKYNGKMLAQQPLVVR